MLGNLRAWLNGLSDRIITEQDSEQEKLNKTLLIFACGLMGFGKYIPLARFQARNLDMAFPKI